MRIADKAVTLYSPGLPAATATARWIRKVGAVLRGQHGLLGHFLQPVFCGRFVHCFRYVLSSVDAVDSRDGPSGLCCCLSGLEGCNRGWRAVCSFILCDLGTYVLSSVDARFDSWWVCDGDRECLKKYPFLWGRSMPEWH